ncbi:MAG: hypothetical protein ACM3TT_13445 [Syntrophothermus sp.]
MEEVANIIKNVSWEDNDDVTRALFFHTKAFRGIPAEMEDLAEVLKRLGDYSFKSRKVLTIPTQDAKDKETDDRLHRAEKAIHRLVVLGVVIDYTINYSAREVTVSLSGIDKGGIVESYGKYVASYLGSRSQTEVRKALQYSDLPYHQFVPKMCELLLRFIYEVIEQGRRRAFYEMFLTATTETSNEGIHQRILRYLETTEHSKVLDEILQASQAGTDKIMEVFEQVVCSPNDAAELRGQVARYLESYPDHPGLLILRSLSEIYTRDWNPDVVKQNFVASISSAERNYSIGAPILYTFSAWGVQQVAKRDLGLAEAIEEEMLQRFPDPALARTLIKYVPLELAIAPAWFLLDRISGEITDIIPEEEAVG